MEDQQESALKIASLKNDLDRQIHANQLCISEKLKFETQFLNLKKVMDSWCIYAQKANRCISDQIPKQVKAILGGDYETTASLTDSSTIDPIFNITGKFSNISFEPTCIYSIPKPNRFVKASMATIDTSLAISDDETLISPVDIGESSSLTGSSLTVSTMQEDHCTRSSITGKHYLPYCDLKNKYWW